MYDRLKWLHLAAVSASIGLFLLRGYWMLRAPAQLEQKLWRVLPHIIDTLLLASGVALIVFLQGAPLEQRWLQVKLILILVYIFTGSIALKRGRTLRQRSMALVVSIALLLLIVMTALRHAPPLAGAL